MNRATGVFPLCFVLALAPLMLKIALIESPSDLGWFHVFWATEWDFFNVWKARIVILGAVFCLVSLWRSKNTLPLQIWAQGGAYLLLLWISTLLSSFKMIALWGAPTQQEGALVLSSYLVLFFHSALWIRGEKEGRGLLYSLFFSSTVIAVLGLFQRFGLQIIFLEPLAGLIFGNAEMAVRFHPQFAHTSVPATLMNSNYVGSFVALVLPVMLGCTQSSPQNLQRWGTGFLSLLLVALIIACRSRAGLAGVLVGIGWVLLFPVIRNSRRVFISSILVTAVSLLVLVLFKSGTGVGQSNRKELKQLSISNGALVVVTEAYTLIASILNSRMHFTDFSQREIPTKLFHYEEEGIKKTRISLLAPGFENFYIDAGERVNFVSQFELSDPRFHLRLASTKEGIKVAAWNRLVDSENPTVFRLAVPDSFASMRGYVWARTLPLLQATSLVGRGPGSFAAYFPQRDFLGKLRMGLASDVVIEKPHSLYLDMAFSSGLLSLAVFLSLLASFFFSAIGAFATTSKFQSELGGLLNGICGGLLGYLTAALFNDSYVGVAPVFWILLGSGFGLSLKLAGINASAART